MHFHIHNPFFQPPTIESLPHTWPWLKIASTTPSIAASKSAES